MSLSPPLLFLHLVADRKLNPGAVLLGFAEGDTDLLLPQVMHEDFSALTAALPCLIKAEEEIRLSAGLRQNLQDAGCQWLPEDSLHDSDEQTKPAPPPPVTWISGDWYLAPPAKPVGNQVVSRALALKLVQLVAADADTREIEDIFRRDPVLAYHLLRLVNSPGIGMSKRITSFSQAILVLGRQQLKRWLNLMLFAASKEDHRSAMLLARVGVRARSMELLAREAGLDKQKQELAFMTGMFSLLGILFGLPLADILKPLQLDESLPGALLRQEGELGCLLQMAVSAEHSDAPALHELLGKAQVTALSFNQINIEAHRWILDILRDKQGAANA
jgi:EAL and modified HD-GYP domain-containing signal transduction protein